MSSASRAQHTGGLSVVITAVILLSLSHGAGMAAARVPRQVTDLAAFVQAETGINVTEAAVNGGEARIAYQQAHGAAPEVLAADWLLMMQAATAFAPDVERVVIEVWTQGVTQLEVVAQASDIAAVSSGALDPESFLAGVAIEDRRPPAIALAQELSLSMGWEALDVAIVGDEVTISFFQPPAPDATVLMSGWYDILAAAVDFVPGATYITLRAGLADGSTTTATVPAADVNAYLAGEIEPLELLLAMDMVAGVAPPVSEAAATPPAQTADAGTTGAGSEEAGAAVVADEGSGIGTSVLLGAAALCLAGLVALVVLAVTLLRRRKAAPVPAATSTAVRPDPGVCPQCGSHVTLGKRFCADCGGALAGSIPPSPR